MDGPASWYHSDVMEIKLAPEAERYVAEKVRSGRYASADEVIAEALRVLRNVEAEWPGADDDLRREIDMGLRDVEGGRVGEWDLEEMKKRVSGGARARGK